jgi:hypothetical protein
MAPGTIHCSIERIELALKLFGMIEIDVVRMKWKYPITALARLGLASLHHFGL